jgi:GTP-binding protein
MKRWLAQAAATHEKEEEEDENYTPQVTVCILGPPNAGKSTLFNRLNDKQSNKSYILNVDKKHRQQRHYRRTRTRKIIGRHPKSRYSGMAIVSQVPGTTRDRRECIGRIGTVHFRLFDTAGVEGALTAQQLLGKSKQEKKSLQLDMMRQTLYAAKQSDLVFLMFDARTGLTSDFLETMRWLRKIQQTRIIVLANKLEGEKWNYQGSPVLENIIEVEKKTGLEPILISAEHGEGLTDIAVAIQSLAEELGENRQQQQLQLQQEMINMELHNEHETGLFPNNDVVQDKIFMSKAESGSTTDEKPLQLAILGRQNVGKSTLVNALLGQERVIVGETPGLTRDAIAVDWYFRGRPVRIVDTAGIRKRPKRDHANDIEDLAVQDAMRAMKVADVAVLVLDAGARRLQRQELAIADAVLEEGRALVIAANKMDLLVNEEYSKEQFAREVREQLEERFPILRRTPVVAMSALHKECVEDLMPIVFNARDRWAQTITTGKLNSWLKEVNDGRFPTSVGGKNIRIKYAIQTKGRPPTFLLFCNADKIPDNFVRYLTRHFQDSFQMFGMPVRMAVKLSAPNRRVERKRSGSGVGGHAGRKKRKLKELRVLYGGLTKNEARDKFKGLGTAKRRGKRMRLRGKIVTTKPQKAKKAKKVKKAKQ